MKNNLVSTVLGIGLVILYFLHFSANNKEISTIDEDVVLTDSIAVDSSATIISVGDSTLFDSLTIAEYSKVGYLDIVLVVAQCPSLRKIQEKIGQDQQRIAQKERSIKTKVQKIAIAKQEEAQKLDKLGMMTQGKMQSMQEEVMIAQQEGEQQMAGLEREFEQLKLAEAKFSQKLDNIIAKGLDIINKKVKLDYILIEKRELNTVYALNKKNDITDIMIQYINSQQK